MERFNDKVVIVTGAASGIGEAVARRFSEEGANVVLVDRNDPTPVAKSLPEARTMVCKLDVSTPRAMQEVVEQTVSRFNGLDVLVNNAGIFAAGDPADITDEDWHKVIATDLDSVFYGCRAALPELRRRRGCIVNTASVSGLGADWGMSPYNAAKGGVVNLTRALALDLGKDGVRVNAVCPGLTRTGMTRDMMTDEAVLTKFRERVPLGRVCEPSEVAAVVAFLASDDASFISGANVPVDGGLTASNGQPPQN
ncbi:SDR family NAD(P)-dependent oxidoreductase [Uliginosibacterium sp. sgz301328]|uniref:SDR family NAD(P)-dependent oxidoreductase n=1 Tax=Uliginosibacterium sp. sgz301328 TaxID=3243764 RepID=UPI00359DB1ED